MTKVEGVQSTAINAAVQRQCQRRNSYVEHLPEVGAEALGKPGVTHLVYYHDDDCPTFDGNPCSLRSGVRVFAEPKGS